MKVTIIRSWPMPVFLFMLSLLLCCLMAPFFAYFAFPAVKPLDSMQTIVLGIIAAVYYTPVLLLLRHCIHQYAKFWEIDSDSLKICTFARPKTVLYLKDISVFGSICLAPRSTRIFVSTAKKEDILTFFEHHQDEARRIYGERRLRKASNTSQGLWEMALVLYAYQKPHDVYYLDYASKARILLLESLLGTGASNLSIFE